MKQKKEDTVSPTSSTNQPKDRNHVIMARKMEDGTYQGSIEFDWYNYDIISAAASRHVISVGLNRYFVISNDKEFPRAAAEVLVEKADAGKFFVFDLTDLSVKSYGGRSRLK